MALAGRDRWNSIGATGLMASFLGWRQAFESAVMRDNDSTRRAGNVRTVNRNRRSLEHALAGAAFGALALGSPAIAADMPLKAPPIFGRRSTGPASIIGGHVGYGGGSFGPDTNPLPLQGVFFPHSITGLIGGYQAGYNFQLPNNLVLGAEVDVSFLSTLDRPRLVPAPFNTTLRLYCHGPGPRRIRIRNAAALSDRRRRLGSHPRRRQ